MVGRAVYTTPSHRGTKQLSAFFKVIISAEDVKQGKPDPEVFLKAAENLGVSPRQCVVFEDAHVGIEAARAAGMVVIGVASTHKAETLTEADSICHRLDELKVSDIEKLLSHLSKNPK